MGLSVATGFIGELPQLLVYKLEVLNPNAFFYLTEYLGT